MVFANSPSLFAETNAQYDDDDKQRKDDDKRHVEPDVERIILHIHTRTTVNNFLQIQCICQVVMSFVFINQSENENRR